MVEPKECQECHKPHDFSKECSGACSTCHKKYLCYDCCYDHKCIPGQPRHLLILDNPVWSQNLINVTSKKGDCEC